MPSWRHRLFATLAPLLRLKAPRDNEHARTLFKKMQSDQPASPTPRILKRMSATVRTDAGFPVWTIAPREGGGATRVVVLHGGAYVGDASSIHWSLCAEIVETTGSTVIFPLYPLAPDATWSTSFAALADLARGKAGEESAVLMGDSAGGGLALGLAQHLAREGARPRVALISPWLDVTMSHPETAAHADLDPLLNVEFLIAAGRAWAGGDDPRRAEVSPQFGSLAGIRELLVISGTRDVLYPQAVRLVADAAAAQVPCTAILEEGLIHDYALLPVPEAKRAVRALTEFVQAHA
jgi:monoterpene epsilon-lactone hydrolase